MIEEYKNRQAIIIHVRSKAEISGGGSSWLKKHSSTTNRLTNTAHQKMNKPVIVVVPAVYVQVMRQIHLRNMALIASMAEAGVAYKTQLN